MTDKLSDDIPKAISESTLNLCGFSLRCYVLDNGQRVFNCEDVELLFSGLEGNQAVMDEADIDNLKRFLGGPA